MATANSKSLTIEKVQTSEPAVDDTNANIMVGSSDGRQKAEETEIDETQGKVVETCEEGGVQVGKVIDASLYGTDIMTDGIQFVHHRLNCHWRWAIVTAAFMLMPAVVEAIALTFKWSTWVSKAWLVRLPISCLRGCWKINFKSFATKRYKIF